MKYLLSFMFTLIIFCQPVCAATMYTTEDLNVRAEPGYSGEIIDVLDKGESVDVLFTIQRELNWAIITFNDGLKAVCADYLSEDKPEPTTHYYGSCRITFYDSCASCCGQWAGGPTASGVMPTANHTVACGGLPFGTRLLIDGQEYVVEDRGVGAYEIDVYVNNHAEIPPAGMYYTDVYIIDG